MITRRPSAAPINVKLDRRDVAAIAIIAVVVALPNFPGRINADTAGMLVGARSGDISDWHAPIVQLVWRQIDGIVPPGVLFALQTLVLVGTTHMVLRWWISSRAAVACSVVLWLNPLGYALASSFTRDVWMVCGYTSTVLLVLITGRRRAAGEPVALPIAACALSVAFCLASRQNAFALLAPIAFTILWARGGRHRARVALAGAGAMLVLPLLLLDQINGLLPVKEQGPETAIMLADLDEFSSITGANEVPAAASTPGLTLQDLEGLSSIYVPDAIWFGPQPARVHVVIDREARREVRKAWVDMVTTHPVDWMRIRGRLFLRQIGVSGPTRNTYLPAEIGNSVGIHSTFPGAAERATSWLSTIGSPEHPIGRWATRAWLWLAAATVAGVMLRNRRLPGLSIVTGSWLYVLTNLPGATDLEYRFVAPSVVMSQAVLLFAFCTLTLPWLSASVAPPTERRTARHP